MNTTTNDETDRAIAWDLGYAAAKAGLPENNPYDPNLAPNTHDRWRSGYHTGWYEMQPKPRDLGYSPFPPTPEELEKKEREKQMKEWEERVRITAPILLVVLYVVASMILFYALLRMLL